MPARQRGAVIGAYDRPGLRARQYFWGSDDHNACFSSITTMISIA